LGRMFQPAPPECLDSQMMGANGHIRRWKFFGCSRFSFPVSRAWIRLYFCGHVQCHPGTFPILIRALAAWNSRVAPSQISTRRRVLTRFGGPSSDTCISVMGRGNCQCAHPSAARQQCVPERDPRSPQRCP
jgi:hypothetical protein